MLNAGIGGTVPLHEDGAIERADRILAMNLRGAALGIRAAVAGLSDDGHRSIVVTASMPASSPTPARGPTTRPRPAC